MNLCPWADVVYGCDRAWWDFRRGLPEFTGLKVCWAGNGLADYPDIRRIEIAKGRGGERFSNALSFEPGIVGSGSNSGFQALNLALLFGARQIILVGFDMQRENIRHWYGRNHWMRAGNPNASNFPRWVDALNSAATIARNIGADVVNASPTTAVTGFRRASIEKALAEWIPQSG